MRIETVSLLARRGGRGAGEEVHGWFFVYQFIISLLFFVILNDNESNPLIIDVVNKK